MAAHDRHQTIPLFSALSPKTASLPPQKKSANAEYSTNYIYIVKKVYHKRPDNKNTQVTPTPFSG